MDTPSGTENLLNKRPCFFLCDLQGIILFSSSALCTHFRIKGYAVRGKAFHFLKFWTEESRKALHSAVALFSKSEHPVTLPSLDYFLQNKQQKTDLHIHPNLSDNDKIIEIYFSFPEDRTFDFSRSLLEDNNFLNLNHLQCAIFIHSASPDGTPTPFYQFNQKALALTGYTPEELSQKTPYDLSSESLKNLIGSTNQKLFVQGMSTFQGAIIHKNGKKVPIEGTTFRIFRENKIYFISFLNPHIPQEKKEYFRFAFNTLFDHSFMPVCERDYSCVHDYFDGLKQSGVFDLMSYLMTHPEEVKKCVSLVKTLKVNQAFMEAMESPSKDSDYIRHFITHYLEKSFAVFCEILVHLAELKTYFELKMEIPTARQTIKHFQVKFIVIPGHEKTLKRVLVMFLDLSPRKQIQDSLTRSEKAYGLLVDNLTSLIQRFDSFGRCLFTSPPFEVFTGIPVQNSLGKTYSELGFSDPLCRFIEEELQNVFTNRKKSEKSFPFPLKTKETLCSWRFIPELSEKGEILSVLCIIRDISFYQVIADYHLMKMEQLELAIKIAGICFVEWKQEEDGYSFGGVHKEIFGKDMNACKNLKELHNIVHPEDLTVLIEAKNRLISGEKQITMEFRIFWPDGSLHWLKAIAFSQFDLTSTRNRIISVAMDMTSRKEAEEQIFETKERFRQVTENINEIFSLWDLESQKQVYLSPAFQKITGYDTLSMSGDQILSEVVYPEDRTLLLHAANQLLTEKKDVHTEIRIKTRAGKLLWFKTKFSPVFNKTGEISRIAVLCTDITVLKKQTEKEALHREKMAQTEKLATLGMFISSIAHELNNPVNYLLLNTGIITQLWGKIQPVLDEYHRQHPEWMLSQIPYLKTRSMLPGIFRGLEEGAQKINTLVSDLRNHIKKDVHNLNQKIDLHSLISSALPFCRDLISKSTSDFQLLLTPDLPPAKGNAQQIEQVILNLINNSCQALSNKSQKIILETLYDRTRKYVGIRVSDEGIGISKANLDKIREPFFTTKADKGIGLGLSIVASIMENHRGTLDIVSTQGKGTVVTVWIPLYN